MGTRKKKVTEVKGFVARTDTGMPRSRDGRRFWPQDHYYVGEPTEVQASDMCLVIRTVATKPEGVPTERDGQKAEREVEEKFRKRMQDLSESASREMKPPDSPDVVRIPMES